MRVWALGLMAAGWAGGAFAEGSVTRDIEELVVPEQVEATEPKPTRRKTQFDGFVAPDFVQEFNGKPWRDQSLSHFNGIVVNVTKESEIEIATNGDGSQVVRIRLWEAEAGPEIIAFLLIGREIACDEATNVKPSENDGVPSATCRIITTGGHPYMKDVGRFIQDHIKTETAN